MVPLNKEECVKSRFEIKSEFCFGHVKFDKHIRPLTRCQIGQMLGLDSKPGSR